MKLMTIFGTRPEIIRLSVIVKVLDRFCDQVLIHTGQNYDANLSDVFLRDLSFRPPNEYLGVRSTGFAEQVAAILSQVSLAIDRYHPDKILVLGDTNSGLASIVAARRGIPVYHLEAGNRCYDDRVPEEVNRRIIDHCSAILMPYTHRSKENLLREGIERDRIFVIGNPIGEVLDTYAEGIMKSGILNRLQLKPEGYFLITMHRAENVDIPQRLKNLVAALHRLSERYGLPVLVSLHPHTADKMRQSDIRPSSQDIRLMEPFGLIDYVALEKNALCVVSDSGTVQEECCIFKVPNVTIRDVTERAETIESGSNVLAGVDPDLIMKCVEMVLGTSRDWSIPPEYLEKHPSVTVAKIVLGAIPASAARLNLSRCAS